MFGSVNSKLNNMKVNEAANRFIVESVIGDDVVPFEDEDEALVDVDAVNPESIRKINNFLDKTIGSDKYDEDDIDELLDDEDEEALDSIIDAEDIDIEDIE